MQVRARFPESAIRSKRQIGAPLASWTPSEPVHVHVHVLLLLLLLLYFLTILLLSFPSETYTNIYAIPAQPAVLWNAAKYLKSSYSQTMIAR